MADLQNAASAQDWEQLDGDTRYLTHSLHRYSGKFIPQIAGQAIDLISAPGELVLDPYTGSGTSLLEAALSGRHSIGIDLNPLACVIAKVKTTPIAPPRWTEPSFVKWFPDERRRELVLINQLIQTEPASDLRRVGWIAFSEILRQSSMANTSYPNVMYDRRKTPPRSAIPRFLRRLVEVCDAVAQLHEKLPDEMTPTVLQASACSLPLEDESIDAIVTHPPYIGSIPYAEYGVLSLMWLGVDPRAVDAVLTGGRRQSRHVVTRFQADFAETFHQCYRVLRRDRHLAMLLGSPTVRGERIDLPAMAQELARSCGFVLEGLVKRKGGNRRANLMAEETLLFFRRPA